MEGGLRKHGFHRESSPEKPLLSIVTVVYNGARQIEPTILSILDQTYGNAEYIIIDGGSTDGTLDIIKKYENRIDYWLSEHDSGIYQAMNKGIELATGVWINFMNCGDRFNSNDALLFFEKSTPHTDLIFGDAIVEYPTFKTIWKKVPLNEMWKRTPFCHQACFVRTALMKENKFDLRFKFSSDFDFLYKLYLAGKKFHYIHQIICLYDYRDGVTIRNELRSLNERKQAVLAHGFSIEKWFYYMRIGIYLRLSKFAKGIIGEKLTGWLTRILKE